MIPWDIMMTVTGYWNYKLQEESSGGNSTELTRSEVQQCLLSADPYSGLLPYVINLAWWSLF